MNVHDAIQTKRAVRKFTDQPISDQAVRQIVNAGRRAQSAKNMQAWHFVAVRDRQRLETLSTLGDFAGHMAGAALGVAILTVDPAIRWSILFDAGQAAAYMQLEAWEMGIGSCMATIYQPDKAREVLGFPADWHVHACISFGFPSEPDRLIALPRKGGRNALDEILHWEQW